MYLDIGNGYAVRESDIIAIFDLDNVSASHISREYFTRAEKEKTVRDAAGAELPTGVVLVREKNRSKQCEKPKQTVYISSFSAKAIQRRTVR